MELNCLMFDHLKIPHYFCWCRCTVGAKNGYTYVILVKFNKGIMHGLKITTDVI